jgi:putative oxidoreductase
MTASQRAQDFGLLVLRAGVGGTLVAHGTQKLFGWFGGHGIEGTAGAMEQMGFRPGRVSAIAAGLGEAGGGSLIILGLGTPIAGSVAAGTMVAAASVHTPNGFFTMNGGYELPALLGLSSASLAIAGAGRYSLDRLTGHRFARPWMAAAGLAGSLGLSALLVWRRNTITAREARKQAPAPAPDSAPAAAEKQDVTAS